MSASEEPPAAGQQPPCFPFALLPEDLLLKLLSKLESPRDRCVTARCLGPSPTPSHSSTQAPPLCRIALLSTNHALRDFSLEPRTALWAAPQLALCARAGAARSLAAWLRRRAPLMRALSLRLQHRYAALEDLGLSESVSACTPKLIAIQQGGALPQALLWPAAMETPTAMGSTRTTAGRSARGGWWWAARQRCRPR